MYITKFIHEKFKSEPSKSVLVFEDKHTTISDIHYKVPRLASALKKMTDVTTKPITIIALNSDLYVQTLLATWWAGGFVNPLNARWSLPEFEYAINQCETEVLFVDEHFKDVGLELQRRCPSVKYVIQLDIKDTKEANTFIRLIEGNEPIEDSKSQGETLAALLYTGGTTGNAKGVMLTHANLLSNAQATMSTVEMCQNGVSLQVAPLFHVGGLGLLIQSTLRSMQVVIIKSFVPEIVLTSIEKYRINETFLVPTMIQLLVSHPKIKDYDLTSLEILIYAASAMDITLLKSAMKVFSRSKFLQFYGMTELSPIVTVLTPDHHALEDKLKSVGRPTSQVELKIVNEDGDELGSFEAGEIIVKGSNVMKGYWKNENETNKAIKNGWMYTGDGGYVDEDGFLYIADRIKDMIISGGENIYSTEVEKVLLEHPSVKMCAVVGVKDPLWGESVRALIVKHDDTDVDIEDLEIHCRRKLAGFKCPRSYEFREELPISGAGKILKHVLRAELNKNELVGK